MINVKCPFCGSSAQPKLIKTKNSFKEYYICVCGCKFTIKKIKKPIDK